MNTQKGFSLVELMVVLVIFVIVSGAIFRLLSTAQLRYRSEQQFLDAFQAGRTGVDLMIRDIHNAGYPPPYTYAGNLAQPTAGPTPPTYDPAFLPWNAPTDAAPDLQRRFAVGIVGVRGGAVDLNCVVNNPGDPFACDVPNSFDILLETDVDPETINPAVGTQVEWVRYYLCWVQADGSCRPNVVPAGAESSVLIRAIAPKVAGVNPTLATVWNVPFVENVMQHPELAVGAPFPDGTTNEALFVYECAGGLPSCTVEQIQNVYIALRVRSRQPDIQTRQLRQITLRGMARRLNPSR